VFDDGDAAWKSGSAVIGGSNNWVQEGIGNVPSGWTGTLGGADPAFLDLGGSDLQLTDHSTLVDAGGSATASVAGFDFPSPLAVPAFVPPLHTLNVAGKASPRELVGSIDIGAYELGSEVGAGSGGSSGPTGAGSSGDEFKSGDAPAADDGGCGCRLPRSSGRDAGAARQTSGRDSGAALVAAAALLAALRRRGRSRCNC
jgi:hypothetical protein